MSIFFLFRQNTSDFSFKPHKFDIGFSRPFTIYNWIGELVAGLFWFLCNSRANSTRCWRSCDENALHQPYQICWIDEIQNFMLCLRNSENHKALFQWLGWKNWSQGRRQSRILWHGQQILRWSGRREKPWRTRYSMIKKSKNSMKFIYLFIIS